MKIVVCARGGIGDLILYTSVLEAFRKKFSDAHIICGTSYSCELLARSIPYFDEFIPDFRPRFMRRHRGKWIYRDRRSGFQLNDVDGYYCLDHPYRDVSPEIAQSTHIIEMAAKILGIENYERKGKIFLTDENYKNASVSRIRRPILVVAPLCSQSKKTPDYSLFSTIVEMFEAHGYSCFKLLPPNVDVPIPCLSVSFPSILDTAAFVGQADYFVGLDAGVSHIAGALEVPLSTIHIGYSLERSGVLSDKANLMYFPHRKIIGYGDVAAKILMHALSYR